MTAGAAEQRVAVSGDENLIDHIQTLVRADAAHGQVLEVRSTPPSTPPTWLRVAVAVPVFRFVGAKDVLATFISAPRRRSRRSTPPTARTCGSPGAAARSSRCGSPAGSGAALTWARASTAPRTRR